jgi:hypothetical protein
MKQERSQKEEPVQENHRDPPSEIPSPVHTDILMGISAFFLGVFAYSFSKGWFFIPAPISRWIGWYILALAFELLLLVRVIARFRTLPLEAYAPFSPAEYRREKMTTFIFVSAGILACVLALISVIFRLF